MLVAAVLLVIAAGCATDNRAHVEGLLAVDELADEVAVLQTHVGDLPVVVVELETLTGDRVTVAALVADDTRSREQGLMGVEELADGTGMLFLFDQPTTAGFWMSGTHLALDIAFISDGAVVGTATMQPCDAAPCPVTRPPHSYDAALEVPAGWFGHHGVNAGATVTW